MTSKYQITTYAPNDTVVTSASMLCARERVVHNHVRRLASRLDLAPLSRIVVERMAASGYVAEKRTYRVDYSPPTNPAGRITRI